MEKTIAAAIRNGNIRRKTYLMKIYERSIAPSIAIV